MPYPESRVWPDLARDLVVFAKKIWSHSTNLKRRQLVRVVAQEFSLVVESHIESLKSESDQFLYKKCLVEFVQKTGHSINTPDVVPRFRCERAQIFVDIFDAAVQIREILIACDQFLYKFISSRICTKTNLRWGWASLRSFWPLGQRGRPSVRRIDSCRQSDQI